MFSHPKITFITDKPKGDIVLASADPVYMREHLPALLASCKANNLRLHFHCINPDNNALQAIIDLKKKANFTASYEDTPGANRMYYACNRFLVAFQLLKDIQLREANVTSCFITDIDAYFMRGLPEINYDLGLYFRDPLTTNDWENLGTHVAAGAVYVESGSPGIMYLERACQNMFYHMNNSPGLWFVDQVSLFCTYQTMMGSLRVINLNPNHKTLMRTIDVELMDWEFNDESIIWTGKGDRKHTDAKYLVQKKVWESSL